MGKETPGGNAQSLHFFRLEHPGAHLGEEGKWEGFGHHTDGERVALGAALPSTASAPDPRGIRSRCTVINKKLKADGKSFH